MSPNTIARDTACRPGDTWTSATMANSKPPRRPDESGWSPLDQIDDPTRGVRDGRRPDADRSAAPGDPSARERRRVARDAARRGREATASGTPAPPSAPHGSGRAGAGAAGSGARPDRTGPREADRRPPSRPAVAIDGDDRLFIFGSHAVQAALANPQRVVRRIWATENAGRRLAALIGSRALTAEPVRPRDLDRRLGADTVHQGVLIEAEPLPEADLLDLIAPNPGEQRVTSRGPIIVLDQVTDPHNVGAVLRSAAVFGARGLVMTRRHSPPLSGALAKAASGALDQVPVALVQNLARALAELAAAGVTVVGLDGVAPARMEDVAFDGDIAIVLGAEGRGLRELTKASCSALARIGGDGPFSSLNVSNAAAIALHFAAYRLRSRSS